MKNINYIITFTIFLTITGCADLPSPNEIYSTDSSTKSIATVRSLNEALEHANKWFHDMDSLNGTRSTMDRTIETIEVLTGASPTRSSNADSLFYLINYNNDRGFALLGAREGTEPIYAISEQGRLLMEDTIYNKGLHIFMQLAEAHVASVTYNLPANPPVTPKYIYGVKRQGGVSLPNNVCQWGQEAPFNAYCPMVEGTRGVVGCGPVAVGMLLSHYRFPKNINGKTLDWTAIIEGNNYDKIASFLEGIAQWPYLSSSYPKTDEKPSNWWKNRSTNKNKIPTTFSLLGFNISYQPQFISFSTTSNRTKIFDFMSNGVTNLLSAAPLLMYAKSLSETDSHFWVVDKYIDRIKSIVGGPTGLDGKPIYYEADPMLHMVWGWNGRGNGYFLYHIDDNSLDDHTTDNSISINYTFCHPEIFGMMKPE